MSDRNFLGGTAFDLHPAKLNNDNHYNLYVGHKKKLKHVNNKNFIYRFGKLINF